MSASNPEPEIAAASTDDAFIEQIGQTMSRMRVMTGRRLIVRRAIANIAPELELSSIDVLDVINRIGPDREPTIGAISETMRIDPSRGSRIIADMVAGGILERRASQEDGRRSIVVITARGQRIIEEIRSVKRAVVSDIIRDWNEEDISAFARLYDRFVSQLEEGLVAGNGRDQGCQATDT